MNPVHRGAFTILELLATCAVLAVLAGFLIPAVARGTVRAKQASCLSNQRQIGSAILLYANDNDGTLPQSSHTTGRRRIEESWIFTLAPYLENLDEIRICPADSPQRQQTIRNLKATSYVVNDMVFDDPTYFRQVAIPFPSRTLLMGILSDSRAPSTTWDHIHGAEWTSWKNALQDVEPDRHRLGARSADRLDGSSNYLFADGHAENITAKAFKKFFDEGINPAAVPKE